MCGCGCMRACPDLIVLRACCVCDAARRPSPAANVRTAPLLCVRVLSQPHLFRMDKSTGSPPDFFDPNGQNWGFPTYNWEAMAEEGYAW